MRLAPKNVFYVSCLAQDIDLPGKSAPTIHPDPGVVARFKKTFQKAPPPPLHSVNNPPISSQRHSLRAKSIPTWIRSVRIKSRNIHRSAVLAQRNTVIQIFKRFYST